MEDLTIFIEQNTYIKSAIYLLGSLLIGVLVHSIILAKLRKLSEKTSWAWDDIIIKSLGRITIVWFFIAGAYLTLVDSPVESTYMDISWKVLLIAFVGSVAIVLSRIAVGVIGHYSQRSEGAMQSTSIFTVITKILIYSLAVLMVLQTFGISITPFLTALGIGGLAVALALQETLGNFFSGIHLIASKKFKPGDYIELAGGESGFIEDIAWRNTSIRTMGNNLVILPNSTIANATLTNYSKPQKDLSVLVDVGVAYSSDLEQVEKVVCEVGAEVMKKVTGAVQDFDPFIRFHTFADSSINMTVILRVQEYTNQYLVKHEFIKALHKRFNKEGIEIPFPQRDVHMQKE